MRIFLTSNFWLGFFMLPLLYLIILIIARQSRAYFQWYRGTTPLSWFGLALVVLGLKLISKRDCHTEKFNGRLWLSPNVKALLLK